MCVASHFRSLVAYRLATELGQELHGEIERWPSFDRWSLGIQLIRSADSVGANIAEAMGRWSVPDRRRLLFVARGSLHEAEHWITVAEGRGLLPAGVASRIDEISRALNGLIRQPAPD
jgi:four helix bundle protein